ncbi:MAG: hypothetical protein ACU4EQ_10425 [Candidatus Nitrosoglobus sp.]|jgi:hypothetical protein
MLNRLECLGGSKYLDYKTAYDLNINAAKNIFIGGFQGGMKEYASACVRKRTGRQVE